MRAHSWALALAAVAACSGTPAGGGSGGAGGGQSATGGAAGGQGQGGTGGGSGGQAGSGGGVGAAGGGGSAGSGGSGGNGGAPATGGRDGGTDLAASPDLAANPDLPVSNGKALRIYWIDVEGGAATLLVAPTGESLLFDAGWAGARDAGRIVKAMEDAQLGKKLTYFVASHYHVDHIGGIGDLAGQVAIANFVDHGPSVESGEDSVYRGAIGTAKRISVTPGQTLPLGEVAITIVTAATNVTAALPSSATNPLCAGAQTKTDENDEDPQSVGFLARFGTFQFVALGDLTWGVEHRLACPMNLLGPIELFQASQHGSAESNAPQLVHALAPLAIVVNNGASKGGQTMALQTFMSSPGMKDVWQLHRAGAGGTANTTDPFIANLTGTDQAFWIRADVAASGQFTVTNARTTMVRTYQSR